MIKGGMIYLDRRLEAPRWAEKDQAASRRPVACGRLPCRRSRVRIPSAASQSTGASGARSHPLFVEREHLQQRFLLQGDPGGRQVQRRRPAARFQL